MALLARMIQRSHGSCKYANGASGAVCVKLFPGSFAASGDADELRAA